MAPLNTGHHAISNFAVDVGGFSAGYLNSFQVPSYEVDEAASALGPDHVTKKMVGPPKIGDASATFNISQAGRLLDWMASIWLKKCEIADVSVHLADQNYQITRSVEMGMCLITGIDFPDLKAADGKAPLNVNAKWKPQTIDFVKGGGKLKADVGQRAKGWLTANFDVHKVFGLDTKYVTSCSLPKISAKIVNENSGERRLGTLLYSSIEYSTMKLEIGMGGADKARDLAVKVIRNGNVDENAFDDIIVDMLDPSMKRVLGTFTMVDCILKKFDWAGKLEANKEQNAICTLEFLVEDFRFDIKHK